MAAPQKRNPESEKKLLKKWLASKIILLVTRVGYDLGHRNY